MKTRHLTNQDVPMPQEYLEMMRHYLPNVPKALIVDAWKHNATALELMLYVESNKWSNHEQN
jgi:hypothetical protein